jgi:CheY-like chemotaxis protein
MSKQNQRMSKLILVADDDENFRRYLRTMLEESGYQVAEAEDGIKAMLRIMDDSPDLVLLDLAMPTISGSRVTELMNAVPDIRNIPFIVISGDSMAVKTRLEILGAAAIFPKPFVQQELLDAIDSILATPTLEIIEEKPNGCSASPSVLTRDCARPVPEYEAPDWFAPLREGSAEGTLDLLRRARQQRPDDLEVAGYLKLAESLSVKTFVNRFDKPGAVVPRLAPKLADDITKFALNPTEGFLLAQMDGRTDLGSLFFVSGMNRFRTCLLLEKLLGEGIVVLDRRGAANE